MAAGTLRETDILVIGGGIAGCATAYYLAREGVDVLVLERDEINAHASGANSGSLHAQIPYEPFVEIGEEWAEVFAPSLRLLKASMALWRDLPAELGADLEVSLGGGLIAAENEVQMRAVERKAAIERAFGLEVELLSASDLRRMAPYLADDLAGGAICATEGKANPLLATPALARAARARGARIQTGITVTALLRDGAAFRAETAQGAVRARCVVNAAGAEASNVSRLLGLEVPIEGFAIQTNVTETTAPMIGHLVYFAGGRLSLKQAKNGSLLIGGGWPAARDGAGRLGVSWDSLVANLAIARRLVPEVARLKLVRTWPATVNGTADWKPVLGEVPGIPGFYMTVFPWLGFSAGPIVARVTADLLLGRDPGFDLAPFSAARYLGDAKRG
ncbi:MAG: NAD(P)/FAD-dependent oxidoreductase [Alphaproteobacteria bacterium]